MTSAATDHIIVAGCFDGSTAYGRAHVRYGELLISRARPGLPAGVEDEQEEETREEATNAMHCTRARTLGAGINGGVYVPAFAVGRWIMDEPKRPQLLRRLLIGCD